MQISDSSRQPLLIQELTPRDQCQPLIGSRLHRIGTAALYMVGMIVITIFSALLMYAMVKLNPISTPSARNTFWGISYNPARPGEWCPSVDQVTEDLLMIAPIANRIRTYADACHLDVVLSAIEQNPKTLGKFRVMAAIMVTSDNAANQGAVHEILAVIKKHGLRHIDMINVGNEVIYRHHLSVESLISLIHQVRRQVGAMFFQRVSITTVDIVSSFYNNHRLVQAVDVVVANLHPYFVADVPATSAADITFSQLYELQDKSDGKEVIIGETGWPSAGAGSRTTPENYNIYMKEFVCRATSANIKFYWFEAFDASWKTDDDEIERHWGVFQADRTNKTGLSLPPFAHC